MDNKKQTTMKGLILGLCLGLWTTAALAEDVALEMSWIGDTVLAKEQALEASEDNGEIYLADKQIDDLLYRIPSGGTIPRSTEEWQLWADKEKFFAEASASIKDDSVPEDEDNKIIHYILVADNDMGAWHSETSAHMRHNLQSLANRIRRELPHALISDGLTTEDLAKVDLALKWSYAAKTAKGNSTTYQSGNNFLILDEIHMNAFYNVRQATHTIVLIHAHGGGDPYRIGKFIPSQSALMNDYHTEFVLLSCMTGNLQIPEGSRSKVFGTGARGMISGGQKISFHLSLLAGGYLKLPQSSLEFYESHKRFFYPTSGLIIPDLIESARYYSSLDSTIESMAALNHAWAANFIDSSAGQAWGKVMEQLPRLSTPWYYDGEKSLALGNKEVWWEFFEDYEHNFISTIFLFQVTPSVIFILYCMHTTHEFIR